MKKSTVALLLAALAAVAVVAPIAQGTGSADRVKVLENKVKALQARVATLESSTASARSELGTVKTDVAGVQQGLAQLQSGGATLQASVTKVQADLAALTSCVRYKVLPMSQYDGYLYSNGGTLTMTSALDITEAGHTPQAYAAVLNPSCVGSASALRLSSLQRSASPAGAR